MLKPVAFRADSNDTAEADPPATSPHYLDSQRNGAGQNNTVSLVSVTST